MIKMTKYKKYCDKKLIVLYFKCAENVLKFYCIQY